MARNYSMLANAGSPTHSISDAAAIPHQSSTATQESQQPVVLQALTREQLSQALQYMLSVSGTVASIMCAFICSTTPASSRSCTRRT